MVAKCIIWLEWHVVCNIGKVERRCVFWCHCSSWVPILRKPWAVNGVNFGDLWTMNIKQIYIEHNCDILGLSSSNWVIPLPCIIFFWSPVKQPVRAPIRLPSLSNSSRRLDEAAAVLRQLPLRRGYVHDHWCWHMQACKFDMHCWTNWEYGRWNQWATKRYGTFEIFLHHVKLASSLSNFVFVAQLTQKPHNLSSIWSAAILALKALSLASAILPETTQIFYIFGCWCFCSQSAPVPTSTNC